MGMFDSVWVKCPHCNEKAELQSKAGPCMLNSYTLESAPLSVLSDLEEGNGYDECNNCKRIIKIRANCRPIYTVVEAGKEYDSEET